MVSSAADSSASPAFCRESKVPLYIRNPELDEMLLFGVLEELSQALSTLSIVFGESPYSTSM